MNKARLPVCPYCHQILGPAIKGKDFKKEKGEYVCPKCKKLFLWKKEVEIMYHTKKAIQPNT